MIVVDYRGAIVAAVAQFRQAAAFRDRLGKKYATQDAKNRTHSDRADGRTLALYAARQSGQLSRSHRRHGIAPDLSVV